MSDSVKEFGYSQLLELDAAHNMLDGHQRKHVLKILDEYGPDTEVDVRVANIEFTEEMKRRYTILKHEGATGDWDMGKLVLWDWEPVNFLELGFPENRLTDAGIVDLSGWEPKQKIEATDNTTCCPKCGFEWVNRSNYYLENGVENEQT
ncbi:MAG: hypothetical protein ACYSWP_18375 [Planctomycetota bacterium]